MRMDKAMDIERNSREVIVLEIYIFKIDVYVMREMKNRLTLAILRMDLP